VSTVLPMFPLGSVLLPGMGIPLHVFEPRYRQLVVDCLQGSQEFGVTLIARGSEVGGGDVRTDAGTIAHIAEASRLDDGRWILTAYGTRRIRVVQWLGDDPYPRAEVELWPDPEPAEGSAPADIGLADRVVAAMRRVLALRAELGDPAPPSTIDLGDDPVIATWRAAALAGLGPMDLQEVLGTDGTDDRAVVVVELLAELESVLRARLQMDAG
jgi:Lon protease-like protein